MLTPAEEMLRENPITIGRSEAEWPLLPFPLILPLTPGDHLPLLLHLQLLMIVCFNHLLSSQTGYIPKARVIHLP